MKIRTGFVSNSSSSSFTCEICGRTESGWDAGVRDFDMWECENGHIFCNDEAMEDIVLGEDDEEYEIPEKFCPICNFIESSKVDLAKYLEKTTSITRDEIFEEIKKVNKRRKKLYDTEYVDAICVRTGITTTEILPKLKKEFKNYKAFLKFLREK